MEEFYLGDEKSHKQDVLLRGLSKVTLELRVPFLAMVLDELQDFERRTVELDFIAKKITFLVEILFFKANSTAQLWDRLEYHH